MKKERSILRYVLFLLGAMLSSCSGMMSPMPIASTTPLKIETMTPTQQAIPISFSVERMNTGCIQPGETIPVKFIFHNLTNRRISIRNSFSLSPNSGDVKPTIIDEKGNRFVNSSSLMIIDSFPGIPNPASQEIAPDNSFEITTSYFFPSAISHAPSLDWFSTPTSGPTAEAVVLKTGKYFVKFEYLSNASGDDTSQIWDGIVESNPMEICIQ